MFRCLRHDPPITPTPAHRPSAVAGIALVGVSAAVSDARLAGTTAVPVVHADITAAGVAVAVRGPAVPVA